MRRTISWMVTAGTALAIGCASKQAEPAAAETAATPASLTCDLEALGDSSVSGKLTFTAVEGGVRLEGEITGLEPNSKHGFHVHEKGDCSSPDGKSAGGHFNPAGVDHGALDGTPSHAGDLGNVEADASGVAEVAKLKRGLSLTDGATALLGRGVILHAEEDDLTSQPTGAAGARIACGVIRATE
jgi:Cu-Zn family superoxide dismutase